jgi:hypothetical protein
MPEQGFNFTKETFISATRFVEKGITLAIWQI